MTALRITHRTRYAYDRAVIFGPHRLMIRPRDGHDMRLLDSSLSISPRTDVRWAFDTFGNSVAFVLFREPSNELLIESSLVVRRYVIDSPVQRLSGYAGHVPVVYDAEDLVDLAPLLVLQCPEERPLVDEWRRVNLSEMPVTTVELLDALSRAVHDGFTYRRREEPGVQTPAETMARGSGTCRDFAFFFMEAARGLGFASRFVTGYIYDPATDDGSEAISGAGATHAWAEVFLPSLGWIEFDPTNRIVADRNLIRVATTRTPKQALPVSGSYIGREANFLGMEVSVSVASAERVAA